MRRSNMTYSCRDLVDCDHGLEVASEVVVEKYGRVGERKGFNLDLSSSVSDGNDARWIQEVVLLILLTKTWR